MEHLFDFGFYIRPGILGFVQVMAIAWCAYHLVTK